MVWNQFAIEFLLKQLGEPAPSGILGFPACNSHSEPPVYGDCWYNCTEDDISGEDKKTRLHEVSLSSLLFKKSRSSFHQVSERVFLGMNFKRWVDTFRYFSDVSDVSDDLVGSYVTMFAVSLSY